MGYTAGWLHWLFIWRGLAHFFTLYTNKYWRWPFLLGNLLLIEFLYVSLSE